jgi:uncharacterized protein YraI
MTPRTLLLAASRITVVAAGLALATACGSAAGTQADSEELTAAQEVDGAALTGSFAADSILQSTANVNLRTGPSTSYSVLHVVPDGSKVTLVESSPKNGFYKVKHNGTVGWSYGQYYKLVSAPTTTDPGTGSGTGTSTGTSPRDAAITRAKSGVGFSYWWGHGRFRPEGPTSANQGSCSGSCPDCSHSGSYGGDCSGFVAKVWNVPGTNSDLTVDQHPYSTVSFNNDTSQWSTVSRGNVQKADALVYNQDGHGHILIYSSGDGWGSMYAYECKGCSAGCVYNLRTAGSSYHAIRHAGW